MRAGIFGSARHSTASPITVTFQQSAVNTADLTTYTFAAQPIGAASATRRAVVSVALRSTVPASVTIGGVTATPDAADDARSNARASIWSAVVPTGTTADVVVVASAATFGCAIGVWTLSHGGPVGQAISTTANTSSLSLTVATNAGDAVIGSLAFKRSALTPSIAWDAATGRYTETYDGTQVFRWHAGADQVASGASTNMSLSITNWADESAACAAAYR